MLQNSGTLLLCLIPPAYVSPASIQIMSISGMLLLCLTPLAYVSPAPNRVISGTLLHKLPLGQLAWNRPALAYTVPLLHIGISILQPEQHAIKSGRHLDVPSQVDTFIQFNLCIRYSCAAVEQREGQ